MSIKYTYPLYQLIICRNENWLKDKEDGDRVIEKNEIDHDSKILELDKDVRKYTRKQVKKFAKLKNRKYVLEDADTLKYTEITKIENAKEETKEIIYARIVKVDFPNSINFVID